MEKSLEIEIRIATSADLEQICVLYEDTFSYYANLLPDYYRSGTINKNHIKEVIESEKADILIANMNDESVGFIYISKYATFSFECIVPHKYAVALIFFVKSSHRNCGVGSSLLDAAKQWTKTRKLDYLELNADCENTDAIRLYEKENFRKVSHIMRYVFQEN